MRYNVVFEETPEGGFVVSIPALPGCVTQADTHEQARNNIRGAMSLYIEDCKAAGNPVQKTPISHAPTQSRTFDTFAL